MSSPSAHLKNGAGLGREGPHEALRRYEELKFELARIGQAGMQLCRELKDDENERLYQALLARIAEDRFNLAVLGPFNRGKSTLMNAILGMDRLPTGVLPRTSVITAVTYGSREQVLIRCANWSFPQEIPLEKLEHYVTEQGNPSNQQQVTLAEIQLPSEILRRGFYFIDTPGVGSGIAANTAATEGFIPEVDAAIFVTSFESSLDENDLRFLQRVSDEVGKVFVVINKLDLLPERDWRQVVRFVSQRLDSELGAGKYGLFALSAKGALDAKLHGDPDALARSGLPELERALTDFLSTDKTRQFCSRALDRLAVILKRQQLEVQIGLAASDYNDAARELRDQFKRAVDELCTQVSSTASQLAVKVSNEITIELRVPLDAFFRELNERLGKKFPSRLASPSLLFHPSKSDRLLAGC
jgi:GTPase Era involved in 16S rRNA processing